MEPRKSILQFQGQNNPGNRRGTSLAQRYGRYQGTGIPRKQPTLSTEKTLRIYVRRDGNLPILMDCLLRFAWILNLIGWSGIVLHCLTKLHVSPKMFKKRLIKSGLYHLISVYYGTSPY